MERRAQQSARRGPCPALRSGSASSARRRERQRIPGTVQAPSCSRPPQLRSRRRGSGLLPGPGQPIKQNTNVTIFFLLIASPDISARWERKKKDEEVEAKEKRSTGAAGGVCKSRAPAALRKAPFFHIETTRNMYIFLVLLTLSGGCE